MVERGREGLDGRPPWFAWRRWLVDERAACPATGDQKGPPDIHPAALAPTESWVGAQVDAYQSIREEHPASYTYKDEAETQ